MIYSKSEMFKELTIAISQHHCFNYEAYGSEKMPLDVRQEFTAEVCANTKIWYLMGFIYEYVVNNTWDESSPVATYDGGWITDTDPLAIAEAFLRSVIASEEAIPMLDHDGNDYSMEKGICDMLVRKAVAKGKIDRINSNLMFVWKRCSSFNVEEVALFADMQPQTIRNALSKEGELKGNSNSIEPEEVLRWLKSKNRFEPTTCINSIKGLGPIAPDTRKVFFEWMDEQVKLLGLEVSQVKGLVGFDFCISLEEQDESYIQKPLTAWIEFAEQLEVNPKWFIYTLIRFYQAFPYSFVVEALNRFENETKSTELIPTAKDGSSFLPFCRSKSGFRIGAKGSETLYEDYWSALEALKGMSVPYWRRPNKTSGKHGIVTGVSMKEFNVEDINELLKEQASEKK
ncbi:MAG: hypothetical protein JXR18_13190 [Neptuniibacter sp.]